MSRESDTAQGVGTDAGEELSRKSKIDDSMDVDTDPALSAQQRAASRGLEPPSQPLAVVTAKDLASSSPQSPAAPSSAASADRRDPFASAPLSSSAPTQSVEDPHVRLQTGANNRPGPSADRPISDIPSPPPHAGSTANDMEIDNPLDRPIIAVFPQHDSGESEVDDMDEIDDDIPDGHPPPPKGVDTKDWETSESLTCLFCNHPPFLRSGDCRRHMRERCPNNPVARKGTHICQFCQSIIKGPLSDLRGHWNYCAVRVKNKLPIPSKPEKVHRAPPPPPTSFVFDQVVTPSMYTEPVEPPVPEEEVFYMPRFPPSPTYGPPNLPRSPTPPTKRRGSRARPGHIPRPPNAFMLFRSHCIHTERVTDTQANLSRAIADRWAAMPEHEKRPWKLQSEQAKEDHLRKYPGYVYRPRRPDPKKGAATKGKAQPPPELNYPHPRRITVHENPVWSVSFPEDALEQPSGGKRSAPTGEPVVELRKRQRMSEPSRSTIPPPPPPPPPIQNAASSSNGGGITLPTVHMDNGAAPAKTRRTRTKASVPIIAPAPPAPPAQSPPVPQTQPEVGSIVEDLRRRHSVFTRNATPSSTASRLASGDVAETDTRPNSVTGSSQPVHAPPTFAQLALAAGARGQPSYMSGAVPRLSRPLSQSTASPFAPGTGQQSPPAPRLSTFGPPYFSPVSWRSTDRNTAPVRPPSPPVHPLQPVPSSSPKPSHASPPSTSTSQPLQPLMASLLPPEPSRFQPSPARTSSHSPASESSQRTNSNSNSHTPTSSHSQSQRSRPRTQDDVMKDVLASASLKHQQRLQAIRVHWATSRRDEPYVQRLLGERIPEEFRQFHEHYLEHPTCYLPILKSARNVINHLRSELEDLHSKRNQDLELGETISLEIEQLKRDHDRLRQRLSSISASASARPQSPPPAPAPATVPNDDKPRSARNSPSPSASPAPSVAATRSSSPTMRDAVVLPDSPPASPSASPPPSSMADGASDAETEVEKTVIIAPTSAGDSRIEEVKTSADGEGAI